MNKWADILRPNYERVKTSPVNFELGNDGYYKMTDLTIPPLTRDWIDDHLSNSDF